MGQDFKSSNFLVENMPKRRVSLQATVSMYISDTVFLGGLTGLKGHIMTTNDRKNKPETKLQAMNASFL